MSVTDTEGPVPKILTLAEVIAPISTDVAPDICLPRHCARNAGIHVAKCWFRGFTYMGGGSFCMGSTILYENVGTDDSKYWFHGCTDIWGGTNVGADIVRHWFPGPVAVGRYALVLGRVAQQEKGLWAAAPGPCALAPARFLITRIAPGT
eukprot:10525666-Karenia_brevis.AAC.1